MRIPHPADPFRPVDWRHQRCESLLDLGRRPSRRRDDAATWAGWRYLGGLRRARDDRGREQVAHRYPAIDAAYGLRSGGDNLRRWGVEGYLLSGVAPPDIEQRFHLETGTAQAYAEQFFDVLKCLHARYYLLNVVIQLHARPLSVKDAATFVRLYGLMGGRHVVDAVLDYYAEPFALPHSLDGAGEEERRRFRQRLNVHVAIMLRCLPEGGVKPGTWELLSRLGDRLGKEHTRTLPGVRVDIGNYLAGMAPAAPGNLGQESLCHGTAEDAA